MHLTFITDNVSLCLSKDDTGGYELFLNSEYIGMENVYIFVKSIGKSYSELQQTILSDKYKLADNSTEILNTMLNGKLIPAIHKLHKLDNAARAILEIKSVIEKI